MFKSTENFNKLKLTTFKILYLPDEYSSILNLYFTKIYIYVCLKVDAKNKKINPFDLLRISAGWTVPPCLVLPASCTEFTLGGFADLGFELG